MSLIKKRAVYFLNFNIFLYFLFLFSLLGTSFAEQGMKITHPPDGSTVNPGQEIAVTIESVDGFVIQEGIANIARSEHNERIRSLPCSFTDKIPLKAIGEVYVSVSGRDVSGNLAVDDITLKVQQTATLQSLEEIQDEIAIDLDWDGNIKGEKTGYIAAAYGIYSDGIKREIPKEELVYISSDPVIISIDNKGNYTVHKVGEANITVSSSGISKVIPVVFDKPTGIRPLETIPPITKINIQPQPNSAGWYNQDLTITLTATDNEGGSGISEIDYSFLGSKLQNKFIENNTVEVAFSEEGTFDLVYFARDQEWNAEETHSINIKLDKTPPIITPSISPQPNASGWHNSDATVTFSATDKLSGIKSVTQPVTVTTEGANQVIKGEAIDIADNKAAAQVTLNIDKTPPKINLGLKPVRVSEEDKGGKDKNEKEDEREDKGDWYQFNCSSQDSVSGLKSINCGLNLPLLIGFKQKLMTKNKLKIGINLKEKEIKVEAPNPQEILRQLQSGLFSLYDCQVLQLKLKQHKSEWKITQKQYGIKIEAPAIFFKATASDLADNQTIKEVEFKGERKKDGD